MQRYRKPKYWTPEEMEEMEIFPSSDDDEEGEDAEGWFDLPQEPDEAEGEIEEDDDLDLEDEEDPDEPSLKELSSYWNQSIPGAYNPYYDGDED